MSIDDLFGNARSVAEVVLGQRAPKGQDVQPEPEPEAPEAVGEQTAPMAPVITTPGLPMTKSDHRKAVVRSGLRNGRARLAEWRQTEGGIAHRAAHHLPRSYAAQRAHAETRGWVKQGYEGDFSDLAGQQYHALVGTPGTVLGVVIATIAQNPWLFAGVALTLFVGGETALVFLGLRLVAVWAAVFVVAALGGDYMYLSGKAARNRDAQNENH